MTDKEKAAEAWRIVKEYALGDRQPFVVSGRIEELDRFFSQVTEEGPRCTGVLVHSEFERCPKCD